MCILNVVRNCSIAFFRSWTSFILWFNLFHNHNSTQLSNFISVKLINLISLWDKVGFIFKANRFFLLYEPCVYILCSLLHFIVFLWISVSYYFMEINFLYMNQKSFFPVGHLAFNFAVVFALQKCFSLCSQIYLFVFSIMYDT